MAEIVSSAVVQETVSQILSGLVQKYEMKEELIFSRNLERLEMAHIKLEAVLETSEIRPENNDCFRKNRMCSVLLSEEPPEHTSAPFRFASMAVRWDTAAGQRESNLMAHMVVSAAV